MKQSEFRIMAMGMPEVKESSHHGHPDFRVGEKIFATLGCPDKMWGMVKVTRELQEILVESYPDVFVRVRGGWGFRGSTNVLLRRARRSILRKALAKAWHRAAPKNLKRQIDVRE